MQNEIYHLEWQQINITITYVSNYSKAVEKIQGYKLAHIQILADEPLPITETGYRSIFIPQKVVSDRGGLTCFVLDALEEAAKSSEWKKHVQSRKQFSLF